MHIAAMKNLQPYLILVIYSLVI